MSDVDETPGPDENAIVYKDAVGDDVLDIRRLRPPARKFTLPGDESGKVFSIDGSLSVDLMIDLFDGEANLLELRGAGLRDECRRISMLIRDALLDDPANGGEVPEFTLSRQEALTLSAYLSGNNSVAEAVQRVITGARLGDEKPDVANDNAFADAEALAKEHLDAEEPETPLGSRKRSGSRSSRSGTRASGDPNGGSAPAAPGRRSRSTASTQSTRAAVADGA